MRNTGNITKTVTELVSLTCDRCKRTDSVADAFETQEYFSVQWTGGYGSVFGDCTRFELDLCQHCGKYLFGEFVRELPLTVMDLGVDLVAELEEDTGPGA